MIKLNGYYKSFKSKKYEDSYGGNYVTDNKYTYLIFYSDGSASYYLNEKPKISKIEADRRQKNSKANYRIKDDIIQFYILPDLDFVKPLKFRVTDQGILIDESLEEYHFHPWEEAMP